MRLLENDKLSNRLVNKLTESNTEKNYSAREVFEMAKERRVQNGKNPEDIKIAAENDTYILSATKVDDTYSDIVLNIHSSDRKYNIYISMDQDYNGKVLSAKVGWPSIGAVPSDEAKEFADELMSAAEFATMIDGKDYSNLFKEN